MTGQEIKLQHLGYVAGSSSGMTVMKLKSNSGLTAYRKNREKKWAVTGSHPFLTSVKSNNNLSPLQVHCKEARQT